LAKKGYFVGSSGGGKITNIMFGRNYSLSSRIYWNGEEFISSSGDLNMTWSNSSLTIEHENLIGLSGVSINWQGGRGELIHPIITAEVNDRTIIKFYDISGNVLSTPSENF